MDICHGSVNEIEQGRSQPSACYVHVTSSAATENREAPGQDRLHPPSLPSPLLCPHFNGFIFSVTLLIAESLIRTDQQLAAWILAYTANFREVNSDIHKVKQFNFRNAPPSPSQTLVSIQDPSQALFLAVGLKFLLNSMVAANATFRSTSLEETWRVPQGKLLSPLPRLPPTTST